MGHTEAQDPDFSCGIIRGESGRDIDRVLRVVRTERVLGCHPEDTELDFARFLRHTIAPSSFLNFRFHFLSRLRQETGALHLTTRPVHRFLNGSTVDNVINCGGQLISELTAGTSPRCLPLIETMTSHGIRPCARSVALRTA